MNRDDIVAKMALREREIFEKYKNTFPFPIRQFVEDLEIEIIKGKEIKKASQEEFIAIERQKNGKYQITIPQFQGASDNLEGFFICVMWLHLFFQKHPVDPVWGHQMASVFLMPKETFMETGYNMVKKSEFSIENMANYFGVPIRIIEDYIDYLKSLDKQL